jgi:hypothetical protein
MPAVDSQALSAHFPTKQFPFGASPPRNALEQSPEPLVDIALGALVCSDRRLRVVATRRRGEKAHLFISTTTLLSRETTFPQKLACDPDFWARLSEGP